MDFHGSSLHQENSLPNQHTHTSREFLTQFLVLMNYQFQTMDLTGIGFGNQNVQKKIKNFIWIVLHNRLFTNAERFRRHLCNSPSCPGCNEDESWIHIMRDCDYARRVWTELKIESNFFNRSGSQWIKYQTTYQGAYNQDLLSSDIFLAAIWDI